VGVIERRIIALNENAVLLSGNGNGIENCTDAADRYEIEIKRGVLVSETCSEEREARVYDD